jgi:murein L,D-transpeptidase YcbB/YkuD
MWLDRKTRFSKGPMVPVPPARHPLAEPINTVRGVHSYSTVPKSSRALAALLLGWVALASAAAGAPPTEALRLAVEKLRSSDEPPIGAGSTGARALIASLYEKRGFEPLWADTQRAASLIRAVEASATHGLVPHDYHAEPLRDPAQAADRAQTAAERDLLLTDAFVRLAYHLYFGKADPRRLQYGWNFARSLDGADAADTLAHLLAEPDPAIALDGLAPRLAAYRDLRAALAQLRSIAQRGGWPRVDDGPKMQRGSTGPRVQQLRTRLRASGDLAGSTTDADFGTVFDDGLDAALRRFQARHGLEADGVAGRATVAALNATVAERIAQVRANLERLRWVARELAGDYLLVDIAGFNAQLWLDDVLAWQARVVVGRPYRTTPEFRAPMKYLVLNPEWNVPPTILRQDVLPKVIRDPAYLQRHHMRVLDRSGRPLDPATVDWQSYRGQPRTFPYQVVQAPGQDNPLGAVKFMFPNEHSVYLHDTPSRGLFDRTVRAFSSGCIRIDRPLDLAVLLIDDPQHWGEQQLAEAIAGGRTQTVPVRRQVPVMLLYFTATVAAGELQFRPDLYDRDGRIIEALAAPFRFAPVDAGRRTLPAR